MRVRDIMTRGVECVRPTSSIQQAAERMRNLNVGALPVCDNDRLAGMVTDRDITIRATAAGRDAGQTCVRDVMTPDITWCFEDEDLSEAAHLMGDNQIRRLAVLDHNKRLVGIVSLGDIAAKTHDDILCGTALEEVSEPASPVR